jgi:hypothetical protein
LLLLLLLLLVLLIVFLVLPSSLLFPKFLKLGYKVSVLSLMYQDLEKTKKKFKENNKHLHLLMQIKKLVRVIQKLILF